MKKIILVSAFVFVAMAYLAHRAAAQEAAEKCLIKGKISLVTDSYVYFQVTGSSCNDRRTGEQYRFSSLFINGSYKYRRAAVSGQPIIVGEYAYQAMGPYGAVSGNGLNVDSIGGTAINIPIDLEKTNLQSNLTSGEVYTVKQLQSSYSTLPVQVRMIIYIARVSLCNTDGVILCPGVLYVVDNKADSADKGIIIIPTRVVASKSALEEFKVGNRYELNVSFLTDASGNKYTLNSFKSADENEAAALIEGRTYAIAELNKNTSTAPRKFFADAYVKYLYDAKKCTSTANTRPQFWYSTVLSDNPRAAMSAVEKAPVDPCTNNSYSYMTGNDSLYIGYDQAQNLIVGKKYKFEISVRKITGTDTPQNKFTLISVKEVSDNEYLNAAAEISASSTETASSTLFPTNNTPAKKSFIGKIWSWFAGLFGK